MTNKRQIKKYIARVGNEIAQLLLPAAVYTKTITEEKAEEILAKLSELETQAIGRLSISYDKKPDAFDSVSAYNAAKAKYFRTAYGQAIKEYEEAVDKLIAPLNAKK